MTRPNTSIHLGFYTTPPYACSYLPGREAMTLFADPNARKDSSMYAALSAHGFRRSGEHLYRPRCQTCHACVPVRIPVAEFLPRRSQRRTWEMNRELVVIARPAQYLDEHYALYERYVAGRHAGGGMDHPTPESYMDFLTSSWAETLFFEFRDGERLVSVAVADRMEGALSAVYTFYDPDLPERSLGRHAILFATQYAWERGLKWLYLGYWIEGCRKMRYKSEYQPLEYYVDGAWSRRAP